MWHEAGGSLRFLRGPRLYYLSRPRASRRERGLRALGRNARMWIARGLAGMGSARRRVAVRPIFIFDLFGGSLACSVRIRTGGLNRLCTSQACKLQTPRRVRVSASHARTSGRAARNLTIFFCFLFRIRGARAAKPSRRPRARAGDGVSTRRGRSTRLL